jgi:HK97 gp10 family phage protein
MALTFRVLGLDRFQKGLQGAAKATPVEMRAAMAEATLAVESTARSLAPRDTGRLQGSISSRITGSSTSLVGEIGPSVRYGLYVERGTRPHWPPVAALSGWARRHGVSPFAVARSIARKGTRSQPFMAPALERNRGKIEAIFARVGARVFSRIAG